MRLQVARRMPRCKRAWGGPRPGRGPPVDLQKHFLSFAPLRFSRLECRFQVSQELARDVTGHLARRKVADAVPYDAGVAAPEAALLPLRFRRGIAAVVGALDHERRDADGRD